MNISSHIMFFKRKLITLLVGILILNGCSTFQDSEFDLLSPAEQETLRESSSDSAEKDLDRILNLKTERQKIDSLLYYADAWTGKDAKRAFQYAQEAHKRASKTQNQKAKAYSNYYASLLRGQQGIFGEKDAEIALTDARIANRLFDEIGDDKGKAMSLSMIGNHFNRKIPADKDSSIFYINQALEVLEKGDVSSEDSLTLKGEFLHDLVTLYLYSTADADTAKLLDAYDECLKIFIIIDQKSRLASLGQNLALYLISRNKLKEAEEELNKSLDYAQEANNDDLISFSFTYLGYLKIRAAEANEKSNSKIAQGFFNEAIPIFRQNLKIQPSNHYYSYFNLGFIYERKFYHDPRQAAFRDSALINYKKALEGSIEEGSTQVMEKLASNLDSLCQKSVELIGKDCRDILGKSVIETLDFTYKEIVTKISKEMEGADKIERKFERNLQEAKAEQERSILLIISASIFLIAILIFLLIVQRLRQRRLVARMDALRAQMNPHFISNSLNAIENLINQDRNEEASKYLIHFSRLSRKILNSSRNPVSSLQDELDTLKHFLALEELRFRDKLGYRISIDPNLSPSQVSFPAMLLQPYVENAIWHGIKPKPSPGHVDIEIKKEDNYLVCIIEDDGVGREKAAEIKQKTTMHQKSMSMDISKERLDAVGKVKGAKLEIIDLKDEGIATGTRIIIRLPYKTNKK